MKNEKLLDAFGQIDEEFVEEADPEKRKTAKKKSKKDWWVKWEVWVACLCLAFIGAYIIQKVWKEPEPIISEPDTTGTLVLNPNETSTDEDEATEKAPENVGDKPFDPGTLIFNDAIAFLDESRKYIPGYFTEELDDKELSAIKPDREIPDMSCSAVAGFDGEGTLIEIFMNIDAPDLDDTVRVVFTKGSTNNCYEISGEPVVSSYGDIDFTIYQWTPDGSNYTLDAYAEIGDWSMQVEYTATAGNLEKAKTDFATIILCISEYADGKPDFSAITAEMIPEYYDKKLSFNEAHLDADFGSFMIQELPKGFSEESIRRYKDQNNNYLSGLWTKGLANLSWNISAYNEEDAARVTGIAQTENYDLALYPIPRAESVPEELREIVNNPIFDANELTLEAVYMRAYKIEDAGDIDGWRMAFSVKYGDVVVEIRTKGVEPEWVYEQLVSIK